MYYFTKSSFFGTILTWHDDMSPPERFVAGPFADKARACEYAERNNLNTGPTLTAAHRAQMQKLRAHRDAILAANAHIL